MTAHITNIVERFGHVDELLTLLPLFLEHDEKALFRKQTLGRISWLDWYIPEKKKQTIYIGRNNMHNTNVYRRDYENNS